MRICRTKHHGQNGEEGQYASYKIDVMGPELSKTGLGVCRGHEQASYLEGQDRQHTGHGIEEQAGENSQQEGLAQTENFQSSVFVNRFQLDTEVGRRRQGTGFVIIGICACVRGRLDRQVAGTLRHIVPARL